MMSDAEYAKVKREYRRTQKFELVMPVIEQVVERSTRPGRIPAALSSTGQWDPDSRAEAAQDWIAGRLLTRPDVMAAFDFATKPGQFYSSLERSFRHFLMNAEEPTEVQNLVEKASEVMRADRDRFTEWELTGQAWWGLGEWRERWPDRPEVWGSGDDRLVSLAWACGSFVITRYRAGVNRTDPVLEREELARFLEAFFGRVELALDNNRLRVVFERRFGASRGFKPAELFDDAAVDTSRVDASLEDEEIEAYAAFVLEEISPRQTEVLYRKYNGETLHQIAADLAISHGTVDNELKRIGEVVERLAGGYEKERVLEKVFDLLSK